MLHTWGQALHHHPHLHCIVPGGGISPDQTRWIACPPGFFLPVRVLSRCFRDLFLQQLRAAFADGELRFSGALAALADPAAFAARLDAVAQIDWVVYSKPPFAGPEQVLGYLGRYTHRVAIANSRLVGLDDGQVSFTWKDYRQDGKTKVMTLSADEFIRRFLQHTVPDGFHRIRHIGFLANCHRAEKLALCRDLLAAPPPQSATPPRRWQDRLRDLTGVDDRCLPLLRRPDAAPRHAAATSAAAPADVVRQFMKPSSSLHVHPPCQATPTMAAVSSCPRRPVTRQNVRRSCGSGYAPDQLAETLLEHRMASLPRLQSAAAALQSDWSILDKGNNPHRQLSASALVQHVFDLPARPATVLGRHSCPAPPSQKRSLLSRVLMWPALC